MTGVNFIIIAPIFWHQKISNLTVTREKLPKNTFVQKRRARKTLMKLTP
jgi:hypothetical protein